LKEYSIPPGARDLVGKECKKKKALQRTIEDFMKSWGYEEVMTPSIEFYKTFQTGFARLLEEEIFKFFNNHGRILTLRMDMTIPIARMVNTRFKNVEKPLRFMYAANVFRVQKEMALKQHELTDCGLELIGKGGKDGDLEVLTCALELLKRLGLQNFTMELGNIALFQSACDGSSLDRKEVKNLTKLVARKSLKELGEYVEGLDISKEAKSFFIELPLLCGGVDVVKYVKYLCFNQGMEDAIDEMEGLLGDLEDLGYLDLISIDFGKLPRMDYYTGLLFESYVKGVGGSILSGGRYDALLEKFGEAKPAIGFSIKLDDLMNLVPYEDEEESFTVIYGEGEIRVGIKELLELQRDGRSGVLEERAGTKGVEVVSNRGGKC